MTWRFTGEPVKLYSIALPDDLAHASALRFRTQLAKAIDQYYELSKSQVDPVFHEALTRAAGVARDAPSMRTWVHMISSLAHPTAVQQQVPNSSLIGHLSADGPSVARLFELIAWEGLGAALDTSGNVSFDLPSPPPSHFPIGELGAFEVDECWPLSGQWRLSARQNLVSLRSPRFAATASNADSAWKLNVRLSGIGIDAVVPIETPALMNRDFQDYPMVRSRTYASQWARSVVMAAEVISSYNENAAACLRSFIRCAVPLVGGDDIIGSASREEALGLVFLPGSDLLDQITECLLHEAMHQYLFRIEECGELFTAETDIQERFYSPWRSDPRPLRMTLHGAFVFVAVADLYLWENAPIALMLDKGECIRRAYHRAKQVRLAIDIVRRNAQLTRFGKVVIDAIEYDLASVFDRSNPTTDDSASIESLLAAHSDRYAAYAR
jgi:HEXXH motif-containing protein